MAMHIYRFHRRSLFGKNVLRLVKRKEQIYCPKLLQGTMKGAAQNECE